MENIRFDTSSEADLLAIAPPEDEALLASLEADGLRIPQVVFSGRRYWFFLAALGVREAEKQGVKVYDQALQAIAQAQTLSRLHGLIMEAVVEKAKAPGEAAEAFGSPDPEAFAEALSGMLYETAKEALGRLSFDRLSTSMSAVLWAGLLPFYPSMALREIDARMSASEVERVYEQIGADLLAVLRSTEDAARRHAHPEQNGKQEGESAKN